MRAGWYTTVRSTEQAEGRRDTKPELDTALEPSQPVHDAGGGGGGGSHWALETIILTRDHPGMALGLDVLLDKEEGSWVVNHIIQGTIAGRSRLRVGDTIATINGRPLSEHDDLSYLITPSMLIIKVGVLRPATHAAAVLLAQRNRERPQLIGLGSESPQLLMHERYG